MSMDRRDEIKARLNENSIAISCFDGMDATQDNQFMKRYAKLVERRNRLDAVLKQMEDEDVSRQPGL